MGMVDFIYNAVNKNNQQGMVNQNQMMQDPMMGQPDVFGQMNMMGGQMDMMGYQQPMMQQPMGMMPQMDVSQMGMMGYGNFDGYGYKPVHYSKSEILEGLKCYIANNTGIMVTRVVKLDDFPQYVKHACMNGKIQHLIPNTFTVPEAGVSFQYWFCMYCGKLFILKDSI